MQILEGEHYRLGPSPGQKKGDHCGKLPPTQLFGAKCRGAVRGHRNIEQRRKKRRRFLDVELYLGERRLEVGEPPFGCNVLAAEASPAPLRDWMQGRILQKLGRVPFNPGVRRLTEPGVERRFDWTRRARQPWPMI